VARKSAKERNKAKREDKKLKLEEDLLGYKIKKLKEEDTSGMYKSILGKIDKLTPTSQDTVLEAMSNKLSPSDIFPMMKYAEDPDDKGKQYKQFAMTDENGQIRSYYDAYFDPLSGDVTVTTKEGKKVPAHTLPGMIIQPGQQQVQTSGWMTPNQRGSMEAELTDRRIGTIASVRAYKDMGDAVKRTDGGALSWSGAFMTALDTTKAQFSTIGKTLKIPGFSTDISKIKLAHGGDQNDLIGANAILDNDKFWETVPHMAQASREFKSAAFELAYFALASVGQTGKAVSDFELKTMLQAIGTDVGSKQQFKGTSSKFMRRLLDNYEDRHNQTMSQLSDYDPQTERFSWKTLDAGRWGMDRELSEYIQKSFYGATEPAASEVSPTSQSPEYHIWRSGLLRTFNSRGEEAARQYLLKIPGVSSELVESTIADLRKSKKSLAGAR